MHGDDGRGAKHLRHWRTSLENHSEVLLKQQNKYNTCHLQLGNCLGSVNSFVHTHTQTYAHTHANQESMYLNHLYTHTHRDCLSSCHFFLCFSSRVFLFRYETRSMYMYINSCSTQIGLLNLCSVNIYNFISNWNFTINSLRCSVSSHKNIRLITYAKLIEYWLKLKYLTKVLRYLLKSLICLKIALHLSSIHYTVCWLPRKSLSIFMFSQIIFHWHFAKLLLSCLC